MNYILIPTRIILFLFLLGAVALMLKMAADDEDTEDFILVGVVIGILAVLNVLPFLS